MIPQLGDVGSKHGLVLPPGRYNATLEEVESIYAPHGDDSRVEIWAAFLKVVEELRLHCGRVAFAWIGGSFVTAEKSPNDVDVIFGIESKVVDRVLNDKNSDINQDAKLLLNTLCRRLPGVPQYAQRIHPLVDGYLLSVIPTGQEVHEFERDYFRNRGYWDQFWSKSRLCGDAACLYPICGYIEVIIDGFDREPEGKS